MKYLILLLVLSVILSGCATIFYPSRLAEQPDGTEYQFDVGMCLVDVICWGIFGFVYDCITGALWVPFPPEEDD